MDLADIIQSALLLIVGIYVVWTVLEVLFGVPMPF